MHLWWALALLLAVVVGIALATNARVRKTFRVLQVQSALDAASNEDEYATLSSKIKVETRSRLRILERKGERILAGQKEAGIDEFTIDANAESLRQLRLIFARLLLTRQQMLTEDFATSIEKVHNELAALEANSADATTSETERASFQATRKSLEERLQSLQDRQQKVEELDADLARIEAHFETALSRAGDRERPQGITSDIGLVTDSWLQSETVSGGNTAIAE